MIFDIILVAIFILLIVINIARGAARALAGILASVISFFASTALGKVFAVMIYNAFLRPAITQTVTDAVNNAGADAAGTISDSLPSWLSGILEASGGDLSKVLSQPISEVSGSVAKSVDNIIQPAAEGFLTFFITIILFLVFVIILRLILRKPLQGLMHLPVLSVFNRLLGGVLGFIYAFLLVSMLAYLTKLILSHMTTQSGWFSESTIYNSFIFYHFYSGNIFTGLSSLFK